MTQRDTNEVKINCFKHRGQLSWLEQLCLASFAEFHPVDLYCYEPVEMLPLGVKLVDANQILHEREEAYCRNSGDGIHDLVRWKFLHDFGGYFVSLHVLCIRPFCFNQPIVFGRKSDIEGHEYGIDVLKFPAKHAACEMMMQRCLQPHFPVEGERLRHRLKRQFRRRFTRSIRPVRPWFVGKEYGFQRAVAASGIQGLAKPSPCFYPVHEARWYSIFDKTFSSDPGLLNATHAVAISEFQIERNRFEVSDMQHGSLIHHYANKLQGSDGLPRHALPSIRQSVAVVATPQSFSMV